MKNRQRNQRLTALLLACLVLFAQAFSVQGMIQSDAKAKRKAPVKISRQAQGMTVAYHSQEDIRNYVKKNGATLSDPLEFAKNPVTNIPYDPGSLAAGTQQSALNMLKQMRYIAGISDQVELSDSYCRYAQAGAFLNYVNNRLTHTPQKPSGMDEALYQEGYTGAGRSNIARASWSGRSLNETIVLSWMEDGDASNISRVGHRRWMLNPRMGKTGFGAVSGSYGTYSSVYAFDTSNASASEMGVAWPAQNMPTEYFNTDFPWSISMGSELDQSKVKVKLTRKSDNQEWRFSADSSDGDFYVNNDGYGQKGCIIFRPPLKDIKAYRDGDSYEVEITGTAQPVSYTVSFFDLEEQKPVELDRITARYQGAPVAEGAQVKRSDIVVTGIYTNGSEKQITDFTIQPYTIKAGSNTITIQYQGKTAAITVTGIATVKKVTVHFDAAGGTAVSDRSVDKGSVLTPIPVTARKGYIFEGWYTAAEGGTKLEATTVIEQDITYYAHWKAVKLSHIQAETEIVRLIEGVAYEYEPDDFRVTAIYTDGSWRMVTDYTIDEHTITAGENTLTIRYGGKSAEVKVNAVSVKSFSAMYMGGPKAEGTTQLGEYDIRLYVSLSDGDTLTIKHPEDYQIDPFVIQPGENTLTVRFGGKSRTITVTGYRNTSAVTLTGITAQYTGGSIAAGDKLDKAKLKVTALYSDGSSQEVYDYTVSDDVIREGENTITVTYQGQTAVFQVTGTKPNAQKVIVQFQPQGGSAVSSQTVEKGAAVGTLPVPVKKGYLFDGWYTQAEGGTLVTPQTKVNDNITYYAHWTKQSDPDEPDGPTDPDNPGQPNQPSTPDNPAAPNQPSTPDNPSAPDTPVPGQPDNPSRPSVPDDSVTVTFDTQGGEYTPSIRVDKNGKLSYIPMPHKSGWIFQGWYTGRNGTGSMLTLHTEVWQDTIYYAYWISAGRTMTGIEVSVNGTAYAGQQVQQALAVKAVYSDGTSEWIYDYDVSQAILNAGSNTLTVACCGFSKSIQIQAAASTQGTAIRALTAYYGGGEIPIGTYSVFGGLIVRASYSDGTEREVYDYALSGNTILPGTNTVMVYYEGKTARFTVTGYQHHTVRLHTDGVSDVWVAKDADLGTVLNNCYPRRSGYQFMGWYLDAGCTQKAGAGMKAADGMHVYAKWQQLYNWSLNKTKATIRQGKTAKLSVKGLKNTDITWKTSNKRIALVSAKGVIKAKKPGTAVITAVTPDGSVMTCTVKVMKKAK